jgi:hypothetical protein
MVASSAVVHTDDIAWWHSAAITVARDTSLLIGEGVGAGRRELAHLVTAVIGA